MFTPPVQAPVLPLQVVNKLIASRMALQRLSPQTKVALVCDSASAINSTTADLFDRVVVLKGTEYVVGSHVVAALLATPWQRSLFLEIDVQVWDPPTRDFGMEGACLLAVRSAMFVVPADCHCLRIYCPLYCHWLGMIPGTNGQPLPLLAFSNHTCGVGGMYAASVPKNTVELPIATVGAEVLLYSGFCSHLCGH